MLSYQMESVDEYKDRLASELQTAQEDILEAAAQAHTQAEGSKLAEADVLDKKREKERIKEKKRLKKLKEKQARRQESGAAMKEDAPEDVEEDDFERPEFSDIESDVSAASFRDYKSESEDESEDELEIDLDEYDAAPLKRKSSPRESSARKRSKQTAALDDLQKSSLEDIALKLLQR